MLSLQEGQYILDCFHVEIKLISIDVLQECYDFQKIRLVYVFNLESNEHLVCRIIREKHYDKELIEKQSQFANFLYCNGIITPHKINFNGNYCLRIKLSEGFFLVTLEEFMGKDLEVADLETFFMFGTLLGNIHSLSEKYKFSINFSVVLQALETGNAKFSKIISRLPDFIAHHELIQKISFLHDSLVDKVKSIWKNLPKGTVHGDLGIYNNLVTTSKGLGIIDFNLAGDEVFLGDLLSSFYSSIHKFTWREKLRNIKLQDATTAFFSGYFEKRKLIKNEISVLPEIASLFDGLFYCKSIFEEANYNNKKEHIVERINNAIGHFALENHTTELFLC